MAAVAAPALVTRHAPANNGTGVACRCQVEAVGRKCHGVDGGIVASQAADVLNLVARFALNNASRWSIRSSIAAAVAVAATVATVATVGKDDAPEINAVGVSSRGQDVAKVTRRRRRGSSSRVIGSCSCGGRLVGIDDTALNHGHGHERGIQALFFFAVPKDLGRFNLHGRV